MRPTRVVAMDVIRILSGIGVLFIHVTDPFITYPVYRVLGGSWWWCITILNALFRTSVPLFIMISGYLLLDPIKQLSPSQFFKRRFARIGIPTVLWITVYVMFYAWQGRVPSIGYLAASLISLNIYHLYFLVLILELYFVTPIISILLKSKDISLKKLVLGSGIFTSVIAICNALFPNQAVLLNKNIVTIFLPFLVYYLLGILLKKVSVSTSTAFALAIAYAYLALFIGIISNGNVTSYWRDFTGLPVMIMSCIAFIVLLQTNRIHFLSRPYVLRVLSYISSLVFGAYLVHVIVIFALDRLYPILPGNLPAPILIFILAKSGAVIMVSFGISALLNKLPGHSWLVGR